MSRRFKILAVVVFAIGIAAALAAGVASIWAWQTPGTHLVFRIVLPLLGAWMLAALVRLALALRRVARDDSGSEADDWRAAWPDAQSCRRIELPAEPGTRWWQSRRRRRLALQIDLPNGSRHYVVGPAPLVMRRHLADRGRAGRLGCDPNHIEDDKSWLRKARRQARRQGGG